ncbi:ABC-F family ATP-binding cassette domain-containing protein [Fundicoccus sp. Sow4_H7]|uniref:ABC-F family ATP-binding cassette domain-containing protein n=1 Tax=Fundicoccus sp. Sow4_H7 TaxID=3438784 RepID=UPI003F90CD69
MIVLQANQLARRFADTVLFEDVSFSIQTNDRIALVGRNGVGKSTLIKQIMGLEPLSSGTISKARDVRIGYLEQHVVIDSTRTIWEEMLYVFRETLLLREQAATAAEQLATLAEDPTSIAYEEALATYDRLLIKLEEENAYAIESEIRTVLHGFRFYEEDYDTAVQSLSGGQKTRLALAQLLLMKYDLLILDEPTNHLDMDMLAWLEQYLNSYRGALLIVSHDRYFLDKVANQVIELRLNTLHTYKGNYSYYIEEKANRLEQEIKLYNQQQAKISQLEDFIARNIVRASTTKRAQSRRKQLEKMERIEKPKQDPRAPRIQFSANHNSGERVLAANDLSIGYSDNQPIASDIELDLRRHDAIAIVGPNGIGKTTLLKTIIGQLEPLAGSVQYGTGVSIGYYAQNVNTLNPDLTVLETLWRAHDTTDEWQIRSILGSFLFSGEAVEKKVSMLSGGEKARLSLALLATKHDNTLLLDEPTNHLDIDSKEILEEAMIEYNGTLLFVSHDRYFINRIATKVLEISSEGSTLYLGDYDYYVAKKEELNAIEALEKSEQASINDTNSNTTQTTNKVNKYEQGKILRRELRKLTNAVENALKRNDELEASIEAIHEQMAAAAQENSQADLHDLTIELDTLTQQQDLALEEWEIASIELEDFLEENPDLRE